MATSHIVNTSPETAPGISLNDQQRTLVGSVLDLFEGKPTIEKLKLWADDAVFEDPLTIARGRKQFEPQWYGLEKAFSSIERLSHQVTSTGNPITMDLKTRYKVKGIGKEATVESVVNIFTTPDGTKIAKVQDKWNGNLPESSIQNVSLSQILSPFWWLNYWFALIWWAWSFVWWTTPWLAFRRLNAVTVPHMVSVPKSHEEEAAKKGL